MSENNVEEKEISEEQVVNEEAIEECINETEEIEVAEEVQGRTSKQKVSFIKSFSAIIVDDVIIGIISIILFYIFDALLKSAGYFISQKISMIFLLFVVVSVLYTSIMEVSKAGKTVGKKLLNL